MFQEVCKLLEVNQTRSSPFHPTGNASVERFNASLEDMLSKYVEKSQKDWDLHLPFLTYAYRACIHSKTGYTPNMLMLGREVILPSVALAGSVPREDVGTNGSDYVSELEEQLDCCHSLARDAMKSNTQKDKRDYDTRLSVKAYKKGDLVYVRDNVRKKGRNPKLQMRWKGPAVVTEAVGDVLFAVQIKAKSASKVLHHDRLKPFHSMDIPDWIKKVQDECLTVNRSKDQGVQTDLGHVHFSTNQN